MRLEFLRIRNLRNLARVEIEPRAGVNLFVGKNGAGKTSIIEAIYILGRGRTFRGRRAGPLISEGKDSVDVFANIKLENKKSRAVGVWKNRNKTRIRVDGEDIKRLSNLARVMPIQIITTRSHDLLERGPALRRRFVDWGLFHVEHPYQDAYSRYKRILDQRNAWLRRGGTGASIWDEQIRDYGAKIHDSRTRYLEALIPRFKEIVKTFFALESVDVDYYQGWPRSENYGESLSRTRTQDIRRGYTGLGVHKADLRLTVRHQGVEKVLSRGQQKIITASLLLAQAVMLASKTGEPPLVLFDDVSAELDSDNLHRMLRLLSSHKFQVFVNSTENILEKEDLLLPDEARMFHVEHGEVCF